MEKRAAYLVKGEANATTYEFLLVVGNKGYMLLTDIWGEWAGQINSVFLRLAAAGDQDAMHYLVDEFYRSKCFTWSFVDAQNIIRLAVEKVRRLYENEALVH